jgi:putative membrane protein
MHFEVESPSDRLRFTVQQITPDFRHNRPLQLMVGWLLPYWAAMAINPFNRFDWLLENLLVFIYGALLAATYRRFTFSNLSYGLFTLFMTLHLTGAHYTYAETPLGFWLMEWLELERNHFDRIAHLAYGLLCGYPLYELLRRLAHTGRGWSGFLAVTMVIGFSGFYEVVEMVVAQLVSPELGEAYLGTQGDSWDAQKDMGLALLGAIIAMSITLYRPHRKPLTPRQKPLE